LQSKAGCFGAGLSLQKILRLLLENPATRKEKEENRKLKDFAKKVQEF
jgi:hypothetical protein